MDVILLLGALFPDKTVWFLVNLLLTGALGFDLTFITKAFMEAITLSSAGKVELTYLF